MSTCSKNNKKKTIDMSEKQIKQLRLKYTDMSKKDRRTRTKKKP